MVAEVVDHAASKRAVTRSLGTILATPVEGLDEAVAAAYTSDAELYAFHPVNEAVGPAAIAASLWRPLRLAFPDLERRDQIVVAGEYADKAYVCVLTYLQGNFESDWHDIPANHSVVTLRCGEIHEVEDGRIVRSHVIIDTLEVMRQAGYWPVAASLGTEGAWPSQAEGRGIDLDACDHERGAEALRIVKAMHAGLGKFDGRDLNSMDHARFWQPGFMWYGPAGIGTTRGLRSFEAHHQIPFLRAFPDRRLASHITNICDGDFVVTGGWPSVVATHTGPDWLGTGPTGEFVRMRVMDFYRVDGDLIAENWVPIDIVDILRQIGVDVFQRVRHLAGNPRRTV